MWCALLHINTNISFSLKPDFVQFLLNHLIEDDRNEAFFYQIWRKITNPLLMSKPPRITQGMKNGIGDYRVSVLSFCVSWIFSCDLHISKRIPTCPEVRNIHESHLLRNKESIHWEQNYVPPNSGENIWNAVLPTKSENRIRGSYNCVFRIYYLIFFSSSSHFCHVKEEWSFKWVQLLPQVCLNWSLHLGTGDKNACSEMQIN